MQFTQVHHKSAANCNSTLTLQGQTRTLHRPPERMPFEPDRQKLAELPEQVTSSLILQSKSIAATNEGVGLSEIAGHFSIIKVPTAL